MDELYSSPSKRSFRSKTKPKDTPVVLLPQKTLPLFKLYLNDYPAEVSDEALTIVKNFEPIHNSFLQNLENVKLYKSQLGTQLEADWYDVMMFLRSAILKINKKVQKQLDQKEAKIQQLLGSRDKFEAERAQWRDRIDKMENMREMEKAELNSAEIQLKTMSEEMTRIYAILQNDMGSIMDYLGKLEDRKAKAEKDATDQIFKSLNSMSTVLNTIETQNKGTGSTLGTMRQLIKAMAKNTKTTTSTQVDESQLQTNVGAIFLSEDATAPFEQTDGSSINTAGLYDRTHIMDRLREVENIGRHETYNPKKNIQKPWVLSPPLLVFLANASKENETGRVLPWEYMKTIINDVYKERIKFEDDLASGLIGNAMSFDEFVVIYFLDKHRVRRLAEVKLLEFIVSLKYYSRFWLKAELFCLIMNVMKFQPPSDPSENSDCRFDVYVQNYFMHVYNKFSALPIVEDKEGTTYVALKSTKNLARAVLFFTEENSKSRLIAKLDKDPRILNEEQHTDFDNVMLLMLDEYFSVRRKNAAALGRAFARKSETINSFYSADEIIEVCQEAAHDIPAAPQITKRFPLESNILKLRLYLNAITNGKNSFEINSTCFLAAAQRYGFDAPFPFLHTCTKAKKNKKGEKPSLDSFKSAQISAQKLQTNSQIISNHSRQSSNAHNPAADQMAHLSQVKVDPTVKLFSQHFSLLREMRSYVDGFSQAMVGQKDPEVLWKNFNIIKQILERGCSFMTYPLLQPVKNVEDKKSV